MTSATNTLSDLLLSEADYRERFEAGLGRLLATGDLNLFILVCANATRDAGLFESLGPLLEQRYQLLKDQLVEVLANGAVPRAADDDLLVFLKIAAIGLDELKLTECRQEGRWEVQFNHLRSFRPLRNAARPVDAIHRPFDATGFHFNRSFMQQETIGSGEFCGRSFDLFYNKFPFADLHALLVPQRLAEHAQYLTLQSHLDVWALSEEVGTRLPTLRIGYNALGAFASVNHLHFQLCIRRDPLPVENPRWQHNGGSDPYPTECRLLTSSQDAWKYIESLHATNTAYNLLYMPGRLYCLPRLRQGSYQQPDWSPGFSWYELCGGLITCNRDLYASLGAGQIEAALSRLRLQESAGVK